MADQVDDDWVEVDELVTGTQNLEVAPRNSAVEPVKPANPTKSADVALEFFTLIQQGATKRLEASTSKIFRIALSKKPLYTTFLGYLTPDLRQEYSCSTCKRFVNKYGGLALVNDDGSLTPLLWSSADLRGKRSLRTVFGGAVQKLEKQFMDNNVVAEFKVVAKTKSLGTERKGNFPHMHLELPASRVVKEELRGYTSASTEELAVMLTRVTTDYELKHVKQAYSMLKGNKLPHADNHKASAKWLLDLMEEDKLKSKETLRHRHNLTYRYAADSFVGSLKQMRSGALSTLLESIKDEQPWDVLLSKWKGVVDPTQYMRPQAPPSAGNIKAAETLFEQLGLTKDDLRRRLLVQDEVPENVIIWASNKMKTRKTAPKQGIFGGVEAKRKPIDTSVSNDTPPVKITFTRFVNTVLPGAKEVECWLDGKDEIVTFITGFEGSKPLLQWHHADGKNRASHYTHVHPPVVESYGLRSSNWNPVRCLIPYPSLWDGAPLTTTFPLVDPDGPEGSQYKVYHKHKGFRYLFVLEDAHESSFTTVPLFPEDFKSELHAVRSTIEGFCRTGTTMDVPDGMSKGGWVNGKSVSRSRNDQGLKMRVRNFNGDIETYKLTLFE